MPLFGKVAGLITGPLVAFPLATSGGLSLLTIIVSLLSSGVVITAVNAWHRHRTGEGRASAAESLAHAAAELVAPLTRQNEILARQNAEHLTQIAVQSERVGALTMKLADAAADTVRVQTQAQTDRHAARSELAAIASQLAHRDLVIDEQAEEIRRLKVQLGDREQDRRSVERRQNL